MKNELRIAIAEDHPVFREGLRQILQQDPSISVISESGNGQDALDQARQLRPDVALLDINLPGLDGLEIARIRKRESRPFEIVFLTMHRDDAIFNEAMDLGVLGYVLKESAATDILKAIHSAVVGEPFISQELTSLILDRGAASKLLQTNRPGLEALTNSERRILKLIASDRTTTEIADDLDLSPRTVDSHRTNICSKLGLRGSHSLLKFAFENKSKL